MTLFREKVLISIDALISGLMSNLIKKSWTDSNGQGNHSTKMVADSLAENNPNVSTHFSPKCLPKPKCLGFFKKKPLSGCPYSVPHPKFYPLLPDWLGYSSNPRYYSRGPSFIYSWFIKLLFLLNSNSKSRYFSPICGKAIFWLLCWSTF